jgi:serine/threonine protein kinase
MSCLREPNAEPIPGYRLIEPLGSGGFGEVWKCIAPGGLVKAIKFVFGNLKSLDLDGVRAEQELQALERIKEVRHPFVLSLDRIEDVEGELVIVMELADKSLHDAYVECQSAGQIGIPRESLLRYIRDASEALDHMNEKHNLQHLDIKPRNLFLISDRVKVADFGLVHHLGRQAESGALGGVTPLYAPPETLTGKVSDRSDQYSLAIVYQELLTGQRPFNGKNPRQLIQQHLQEEPELRSLPEADRPVVARALAKNPADRFPNCLAFVRALYTAQGQKRPETVSGHGEGRPKGLADTLEDILLEQQQEDVEAADAGSPADEADQVSKLGITIAQPQSGALRPTLLIGIGSFGRRALRELRCRFLDRLGDLSKIPLLKFLYIDPDPGALQDALRGTPEVAFSRNEIYRLPLQPIGHYRRRMLDYLGEWMPREKLFSLPRSLQTQGSRALGRLAFVDNHLRLMARLRRDVQEITHPDAIYQSVSQTGLALRDSVPRVCVIAAAGGGGSGVLVDLGYALRRLLHVLRHQEAELNLFLFCGAPSDPATPPTEQANVYATLTELNHFTDPGVPFATQYGADGPRLIDHGAPFSSAYLCQLPHRSPEALRDVIAHLGSYLFHELTTPLGLRLDRDRHLPVPAGSTSFRSFGTYAVWFPRGLLLRLAARQACRRLLEDWYAEGEPTAIAEVDAACSRLLADSALRLEALGNQIEEEARQILGGPAADILTSVLASLDQQAQQSLAEEDPSGWARQALARVLECIGPGPAENPEEQGSVLLSLEWRQPRLPRAFKAAAEQLAERWEQQLGEAACALMEYGGHRVAAAEAGLARLLQFCEEALARQQARWEQQAARTQHARQKLETAVQNCLGDTNGSGWGLPSLFGSRPRRLLRVFLDHLAAFARQCLAEEVIHAGRLFFTYLRGRFENRQREVDFCRQRLQHLREKLETPVDDPTDKAQILSGSGMSPGPSPVPSPEAFWDSIRQTGTLRVVLPQGTDDLERAAINLADRLGSEQLAQVDQALQDRVLSPLGGLYAACAGNGDLVRGLAMPLLDQVAQYLDQQLPITDVAQVELETAKAGKKDLTAQIQDYLVRATPLLEDKKARNQTAFLLVPATDSGKLYADEAQQGVADLQTVRVPGQSHLLFCREQGFLSAEDVQRICQACRKAYEEAVLSPPASPHARFDILDWIPLDP